MQIIPGISLGNITYEMTVNEVEAVMGPDGILESTVEGDFELSYYDGRLVFFFYQEYDFKLSNISIENGSIPVEYNGNELFSIDYSDIIELLSKEADMTENEHIIYDDLTQIESVEFESLGMVLNFDELQNLFEIDLSELVNEEEE